MSIADPPPQVNPGFRRVLADPKRYLNELIIAIHEGRVVPIIGPELLQVDDDQGNPVPLYDYVARKLADQLGFTFPGEYTLQDVVSAYARSNERIESIYPSIYAILQERQFTTPPALCQLAGIGKFPLFITTTFDSLMSQAVDKVRSEPATQVVYSGTRVRGDLEEGWDKEGKPATVFHLLGRASGAPNYVVTEEDTLEFLTKLHTDAPQMKLFDALMNKHLLILGCSFPDWLARFFIRMTKRAKLSSQRPEMELLADNRSQGDSTLALFLDNFSYSTRLFPVSAAEFVNQLATCWQERYGAAAAPAAPAPPPEPARLQQEEMPDGALLISYFSQDRAAAERLYTALSDVADVWYDRVQLEAGDDWAAGIQSGIARCHLFVPVLSRKSAGKMEGYFRREWYMAEDRKKGMARELPFILPVIIDDLPPNSMGVPEVFWAAQATQLPDGHATDAFVAQVMAKLRKVRKMLQGQA